MKKKLTLRESAGVLLIFVGIVLTAGVENNLISVTQIIVQGLIGVAMTGIGAWLVQERP